MLANELTQRIFQHTKKIAEVLTPFKSELEKLSLSAKQAANTAGDIGKTTLILAAELQSFAERTDGIIKTLNDFVADGRSVFEISDMIYALIKNLDDNAFQMDILRFLWGIETARMGEPIEPFVSIEIELDSLLKKLMSNKVNIIKLLDNLILLIQEEIRNEADTQIKNAINVLTQTADMGKVIAEETKATALSLVYGNVVMRSSMELEKRVGDILSVLNVLECFSNGIKKAEIPERKFVDDAISSLENAAFFMNLNAFNAAVETARAGGQISSDYAEKIRQYAGQLHQTHASCVEHFNECIKLTNLLGSKDIAETTQRKFQKSMEDVLFQAEMLNIQLGIESERANSNAFRELSKKIADALTELSKNKNYVDMSFGLKALTIYHQVLNEFVKNSHAESEVMEALGTAFKHIMSEYYLFSKRVENVLGIFGKAENK